MDVVSKATRSQMMAGIRGGNTTPELAVRRFLHAAGLRYRLHVKGLPGRPDIVLPKHRAVVLVHGCFWHQHAGCQFAYRPKSNVEFWSGKLDGNVVRDRRNELKLIEHGWRVYVIWECETRIDSVLHSLVQDILMESE